MDVYNSVLSPPPPIAGCGEYNHRYFDCVHTTSTFTWEENIKREEKQAYTVNVGFHSAMEVWNFIQFFTDI